MPSTAHTVTRQTAMVLARESDNHRVKLALKRLTKYDAERKDQATTLAALVACIRTDEDEMHKKLVEYEKRLQSQFDKKHKRVLNQITITKHKCAVAERRYYVTRDNIASQFGYSRRSSR
jgi:hypothetical protein